MRSFRKKIYFNFIEMERSFIQLKNHEGFEITIDEPWVIRRKSTGRIVKPSFNKYLGYYTVRLDGKNSYLHRVIAEQFIPNPERLLEVDHLNRIRTDNRIENLRWVSNSINSCNRTSHQGIVYEYLDELPDGYEAFNEYQMMSGRKRFFNNLFIKMENNEPRFITSDSQQHFRYLHKQKTRNSVHYNDVGGKQVSICFSRISKAQSQLTQTQTTIAETQKQIAEAENNLSKAILNMTEIIKTQQTQQTHPEEVYSEEEYEHYEPEEDYRK
jgi:hypothetical protein